jgi:hypothetical protein
MKRKRSGLSHHGDKRAATTAPARGSSNVEEDPREK